LWAGQLRFSAFIRGKWAANNIGFYKNGYAIRRSCDVTMKRLDNTMSALIYFRECTHSLWNVDQKEDKNGREAEGQTVGSEVGGGRAARTK